MEIINIKVSKIQPPSFYYKTITNTDQQKLINSIRTFGLLRNIVVRHFSKDIYEVIEGRNILAACITLGIEEIQCNNKGGITTYEAKQINITLNQMHSFEDHASLAYDIAELSEKSSVNELCKTLPYSQDQIKRFIEISKFSWEDFKKQYAREQVDMFATVEEETPIVVPKEVVEEENIEIKDKEEDNLNNIQIKENPVSEQAVNNISEIEQCDAENKHEGVIENPAEFFRESGPTGMAHSCQAPVGVEKTTTPLEDNDALVDTDIVYGQCPHGNNMAVCEECMKEIVKEEEIIPIENKEETKLSDIAPGEGLPFTPGTGFPIKEVNVSIQKENTEKQEEIFSKEDTKDTGRSVVDLFSDL